jgi:hypothetical protein
LARIAGSQRNIRIGRIVLLVTVIFAIATYVVGVPLASHDDQTRWIFWLQTLSGNWSPVPRPAWIWNWEYAASAILAVVINYGPYIAVFGLIWKIAAADRRRRMTFRECMDAFEMAARAELIKQLNAAPDAVHKIELGLADARRATLPIIEAVGGTDAVSAWKIAQDKEL